MVPLVVPADMVILVIQVNLVIGEYDITWDSGDPGEFGDSGYFYEPADSCASDYLVKLLILILENLMMVVNLMILKNLVILVSLMIICKSW